MASPILQFYLDGIKKAFSLGGLVGRNTDFELVDLNGNKYYNKILTTASDANPANQLWVKTIGVGEAHLKKGDQLIARFDPASGDILFDIDYAALKDQIIADLGLGTASTKDVGNAANQVVQLGPDGKLPAVDGSALLNIGNGMPIGSPLFWPMSTPPDDYIVSDGSAISRETYADLFNVYGTFHGAGDGSTTFQTPDLRGVFVRGYDNGRGLDPGRVFGSYQADEIKAHDHVTGIGKLGIGGEGGGSTVLVVAGSNVPPGATSSSTGGAETRGKNIAFLGCVKYR